MDAGQKDHSTIISCFDCDTTQSCSYYAKVYRQLFYQGKALCEDQNSVIIRCNKEECTEIVSITLVHMPENKDSIRSMFSGSPCKYHHDIWVQTNTVPQRPIEIQPPEVMLQENSVAAVEPSRPHDIVAEQFFYFIDNA